MLASHFHHEISAHAGTAVLLIAAGLIIVCAAWAFGSWRQQRVWALVAVGILVVGIGGYRVAEAGAMSHNHLCHSHHADVCGPDHWDEDHTHWLGSQTASDR